MKKKVVSTLLAAALLLNMAACGNEETAGTNAGKTEVSQMEEETTEMADAPDEGESGELTYEQISDEIYAANLGEFETAYETAKAAATASEKWALMAIAEAKLLESAVVVPTNALGGNYAISNIAPYTTPNVQWGSDYDRYHQALVCTEAIKTEDRLEMKAHWKELKGTGEYEAWAKSFLEEKGYELKDSFHMAYSVDPVTWDVLSTYLASDSEAIVNTYDGLLEYDGEGRLQPALAESYEVSDDGLTYTFHLREGVTWVDSQGRKVDDVKADDFLAGMQHMMDCQGGLEYLVDGVITGATEYLSGESTDFSEVGVKALDDDTVEYTLVEPCTYFLTMIGYSIFAPMSRSYYESQGGKFGTEFDSSAADYVYGKGIDSIAYCGPYLVSNATEKNTIVYKANESYWNKDNINIKSIVWLYNDGTDTTKSYNDFKAGIIDSCSLNNSTITIAKEDGIFDDYSYISGTTATSYMAFYNLNRSAFANSNDNTKLVSTQSKEEAARTKAAINNVHFRRAISFAFDRAAYQAQTVGEDLKYNSLRNTYTPGNFVALEEDVTVDINGTATEFKAGTYYGEMMQTQIDADGVPIQVWDPEGDDGVGSSDGYDGWYNVDNAVAELNAAIEELAAEGVAVDEQNPIYLDLPYPANDEKYVNKENAYKQSVESALGKKVILNLVASEDYTGWYYAGYYTTYGYEANYDIYDLSGWAPDFGDPSTYLDTVIPYSGYMTRCFGIY